jgi:hypothetical protein
MVSILVFENPPPTKENEFSRAVVLFVCAARLHYPRRKFYCNAIFPSPMMVGNYIEAGQVYTPRGITRAVHVM